MVCCVSAILARARRLVSCSGRLIEAERAAEAEDVVFGAGLVLARARGIGSLISRTVTRCANSCLECSYMLWHGRHTAGTANACREILTSELTLETREHVPHDRECGA